MVGKTFTNEPNQIEISLGIQRLLIANFPQAWTPVRIDIDTPPTGFEDLGAVVEDTPSFAVSRSKFQLQTGIPQVLQFESVQALEGTFEASLHSNSWRKVQFAFGNFSAVSSTTEISTVASVTDRNTFTVAATTDLESLPVGRQFVLAAIPSEFDKADAIESRISSITADGLTVFMLPTPVRTPGPTDVFGIYDYVQEFVGTSQIREHVILGVADFIDGSQVVHQFFKATPGDEFTEEIRPSENERIPLSFNAFGVSRSDVPGAGGKNELVVARRVYFPSLLDC